MIKKFMMTVAAIMATMSIQAQTDIDLDNEAMYFEIDDMPNAVEWLPAPPDTASTQFVYDITQYIWGKQQRIDADRAQQAINNAVEEIPEMLEQFSVPFGMELSKWGQSRYHWQSDVDASRLVAAAGYARLHTNAEFLADIAAARAEFAEKSGQETAAPAVTAPQRSSARVYRIDGTPASDTTRGIVIEDGQKIVRP